MKYSTRTCYDMWIVINNTADIQSFYRASGPDDGTLIGDDSDSALVDDFYISTGSNTTLIPEQSVAALLSLAALGLLFSRRRA